MLIKTLSTFLVIVNFVVFSQEKRARDYGIDFGIFKTGIHNSITDVKGVKVGHVTLNYGSSVRTGVTAIIPHKSDPFRMKTPTAIYIGHPAFKSMGATKGYNYINGFFVLLIGLFNGASLIKNHTH